jgi:hypothetical protein
MPCAMIRANAIDLDTIDLAKFGIVAFTIMSGQTLVSAWSAPP